MNILLVFLGGGIGSVLRYVLNNLISARTENFPYSILVINIIGSFAIGLCAGFIKTEQLALFLMVGILGGFTTFSAFSLDVVTMFNDGKAPAALIYVICSVVFSILAAFLGLIIAR